MRSALSGWVRRAIALVAVAAGTVALVEAAGLEVDRLTLALLVGLGIGVLLLLLDAVPHEHVVWVDDLRAPAPVAGRDHRLAGHLRVLGQHLGTRSPDDALQQRLARLAERRLHDRHGRGLAGPATDPEDRSQERAALDPDVHALLSGPAVRMSRSQVERVVAALEEL